MCSTHCRCCSCRCWCSRLQLRRWVPLAWTWTLTPSVVCVRVRVFGVLWCVASSMERYTREVESGLLRWSTVHSTEFWRENVRRFEADNFKIIKQLAGVRPVQQLVFVVVGCPASCGG